MAEIVRRRSWGGVLPLGRHVSISGSSLIQCASVSMAPPHPGWAKCYPGAKVQGRTGPSRDGGHEAEHLTLVRAQRASGIRHASTPQKALLGTAISVCDARLRRCVVLDRAR